MKFVAYAMENAMAMLQEFVHRNSALRQMLEENIHLDLLSSI